MDSWSEVTFAEAIVLMSLDGQIVWVNDLFSDLTGFTLEEMLARPRFSLMHPDDAAAVADSLPEMFATGQATTPLRIELDTKAGEKVTVAVTVRPHLSTRDDDEPRLVVSLRKQEDHWESVIAALASDLGVDETLQSIADALAFHGVAVALTIATDDGRRQFFSSLVPETAIPALAFLDEQLDERPEDLLEGGRAEPGGSMITWSEVADLPTDDLAALLAHGTTVAVVSQLEDPSGLGDARYIFLLESTAQRVRMRWMTAHRPQEYFTLALLARHRRRELLHAATHDPLTGLPNRARFFGRITELGRGPVGLLFVDLDEFKPINDAYGHAAGDLVLIEVARRLRSCVRPNDLAARVGGDEFGVVCSDVTDVDLLTDMADRLVRVVAEPITVGDHTVRVGASVGVALGHTLNGRELVDAADAAMYEAKNSGKSRWSMSTLSR